jgi:hypothetical protein
MAENENWSGTPRTLVFVHVGRRQDFDDVKRAVNVYAYGETPAIAGTVTNALVGLDPNPVTGVLAWVDPRYAQSTVDRLASGLYFARIVEVDA